MKNTIITLLFFYINSFSQESGIITYKSFFSVKQATEELKQQNRMWYQEELDHEMMAKQLRFTLQFNTEASIFTMSENMISDIENQLNKKESVSVKKEVAPQHSNQTNKTISVLIYLLTVFFIILKLTDSVDWNWFAVISPVLIWEGFGFLIGFLRALAK